MKKLLLASLLAVSCSASAHTIYVGSLTYHFDRDSEYNETNETLIYKHDSGWATGYFKNSYYEDTFFVGKQFTIERDGIEIGIMPTLIHGYEQSQIIGLCSGKDCVSALPTFSYTKYEVQPTIIFGGTFFSFMIGYEF